MKFIKFAKQIAVPEVVYSASPTDIQWEQIAGDPLSPKALFLPEAKDIPVALALDALIANGILIKNISQASNLSYEGLELDLNMTVLVDPKKGLEAVNSLHNWFFSKKGLG